MYMDRILIKKLLYNCQEKNINNYKKIQISDTIKKKVKFDDIIKVILIPSKEEYFNYSLNDLLWWNERDYYLFKKDFLLELNIVIKNKQYEK